MIEIRRIILSLHAFKGEMAEWSKAHAWKVCICQKWIMGSNPILSAKYFFKLYVLLPKKR